MKDLCNVTFHDEEPPEPRGTNTPAPSPRRRRWLYAALAAVLLGGAGTGIYLLVRPDPVFTLEEVVVRGKTALSPDEVLGLAGIARGVNLLEVDEAVIAGRLAALPFLKGVAVERQLPATLVLTLHDRRPALRLEVARAVLVADEDGVPYRRVRPGEPALPLLSGFSRDDLAKRAPFVAARAREAIELGRAVDRCFEKISYQEARGFSLHLCGGTEVRVGTPPFAPKLLRLSRALRVHPRAQMLYLDDDRRPERVVVRTAQKG